MNFAKVIFSRTNNHVPLLTLASLLAMPATAQVNYAVSGSTAFVANSPFASGNLVIASTYNGYPVTSIGNNAFSSCTSLTNVTIPNSVTSIGGEAFAHCTSLTRVTIPDSVTSIGQRAFWECYSLKSVTIPSSSINVLEYTFHGCIGLTNVTIGDCVTNIGYSAFLGCSSLTHVTFGRSVAIIESAAFAGCYNLQQIYFRGNRPLLGGYVFGDTFLGMQVYYLPGAKGWGLSVLEKFDRFFTRPWLLPNPLILNFVPSFGVQTNAFGFRVSWATNASVVVEACTNFAYHNWASLSTNTIAGVSTWTPTNGWFYFSDPQWTNYPTRLYRVRSQ